MQQKLNKAGYWCGTPDGKFGNDTDEAVRHFQRSYELTVDGKAGRNTLATLDVVSANSPGFTKTAGTYGVYFCESTKKFMYNQQMVYNALHAAGLNDVSIAAFMGNLQAENQFKTSMKGDNGSVGLAQWRLDRKTNLERYAAANSMDVTSAILQAWFIVEECTYGSGYTDTKAKRCMDYLKDGYTATTITKATDYVTALYERCSNYATLTEAQNSQYEASRFCKPANAFDGRFYVDAADRRGYAEAYYNCINKM